MADINKNKVGTSRRYMRLKILYSMDNTNCVTRTASPVLVRVFDTPQHSVGATDIRSCILSVTKSSPELLSDTTKEYSVYSLDNTEIDQCYIGHGLLSNILSKNENDVKNTEIVTGRVCENLMSLLTGSKDEILEIRVKLKPIDCTNQVVSKAMHLYDGVSELDMPLKSFNHKSIDQGIEKEKHEREDDEKTEKVSDELDIFGWTNEFIEYTESNQIVSSDADFIQHSNNNFSYSDLPISNSSYIPTHLKSDVASSSHFLTSEYDSNYFTEELESILTSPIPTPRDDDLGISSHFSSQIHGSDLILKTNPTKQRRLENSTKDKSYNNNYVNASKTTDGINNHLASFPVLNTLAPQSIQPSTKRKIQAARTQSLPSLNAVSLDSQLKAALGLDNKSTKPQAKKIKKDYEINNKNKLYDSGISDKFSNPKIKNTLSQFITTTNKINTNSEKLSQLQCSKSSPLSQFQEPTTPRLVNLIALNKSGNSGSNNGSSSGDEETTKSSSSLQTRQISIKAPNRRKSKSKPINGQLKPVSKSPIDSVSQNFECFNCHTTVTSKWRHFENVDSILSLCNPCGLYWKGNHKMKPVEPCTEAPVQLPSTTNFNTATKTKQVKLCENCDMDDSMFGIDVNIDGVEKRIHLCRACNLYWNLHNRLKEKKPKVSKDSSIKINDDNNNGKLNDKITTNATNTSNIFIKKNKKIKPLSTTTSLNTKKSDPKLSKDEKAKLKLMNYIGENRSKSLNKTFVTSLSDPSPREPHLPSHPSSVTGAPIDSEYDQLKRALGEEQLQQLEDKENNPIAIATTVSESNGGILSLSTIDNFPSSPPMITDYQDEDNCDFNLWGISSENVSPTGSESEINK